MSQEIVAEIVEKMYQNKQHEAYSWIEKNVNEIKNSLIEKIDENNSQSAEMAVEILEEIIRAYRNRDIVEMADCMKYRFAIYMGWEI